MATTVEYNLKHLKSLNLMNLLEKTPTKNLFLIFTVL